MSATIPTLDSACEAALRNHAVVGDTRWAAIEASGADLRDYLQGQITQNIRRLSDDQAIHCAILTPQGKAVSELYIVQRTAEQLLILTPGHLLQATLQRLQQFLLRAAVRFTALTDYAVYTLQGAAAAQQLPSNIHMPSHSGWLTTGTDPSGQITALRMGREPQQFWLIAPPAQLQTITAACHTLNEESVTALRILHGLPEFGQEWDSTIHPLNANLIETDGVDFDKGCYVGQEVTSRMHWRGGIKKRLYRVAFDQPPEQAPCPIHTSAPIGVLQSAACDSQGCCFGIALLPIESVEQQTRFTLPQGGSLRVLTPCRAPCYEPTEPTPQPQS